MYDLCWCIDLLTIVFVGKRKYDKRTVQHYVHAFRKSNSINGKPIYFLAFTFQVRSLWQCLFSVEFQFTISFSKQLFKVGEQNT